MTIYDYLADKWEKKAVREQALRKMNHFAKNETLAVINEKARLHNMSYGQYVLARENGQFENEYGTKIEMKHSPRTAFCKTKKYYN